MRTSARRCIRLIGCLTRAMARDRTQIAPRSRPSQIDGWSHRYRWDGRAPTTKISHHANITSRPESRTFALVGRRCRRARGEDSRPRRLRCVRACESIDTSLASRRRWLVLDGRVSVSVESQSVTAERSVKTVLYDSKDHFVAPAPPPPPQMEHLPPMPPIPHRRGCAARLIGLQSREDLNGQAVTMLHVHTNGRWQVRHLETALEISVKPSNLRVTGG